MSIIWLTCWVLSFPTSPTPPRLPQNEEWAPIGPWDWTPATLALQGHSGALGKGLGWLLQCAWLTCVGTTLAVSGLGSQLGPWLWNREHCLWAVRTMSLAVPPPYEGRASQAHPRECEDGWFVPLSWKPLGSLKLLCLFFFIFLILFFYFLSLGWSRKKRKKKFSLCRNIFFVFHLFFILILLEYSWFTVLY